MHVVITGGLGFIGSHISTRLLEDGHRVTIVDNFATSVVREVANAELINADLGDDAAAAEINLTEADCLMHLAGSASGPSSALNPVGTVADGYRVTHNAMELGARIGVKRVINASSMTVYGNPPDGSKPVREDAICLPISHYAIGKFANERLVEIFCRPRGISYNHLRMFNVYGPGQDLSRMDQGIVSIFIALLMKSPEIASKGSLDRFRDIVHIDDVVTSWVLCATQNPADGPLNVGSGEATTIKEMITVIADELGIGDRVKVEVAEGTPGDIFGIFADVSAIRAATGYPPAFTPSQGVRQFTRWAMQNH